MSVKGGPFIHYAANIVHATVCNRLCSVLLLVAPWDYLIHMFRVVSPALKHARIIATEVPKH